jgi:hypothetical protein
MVLYLHLGPFAKLVVRELDRQIGAIDGDSSLSMSEDRRAKVA